ALRVGLAGRDLEDELDAGAGLAALDGLGALVASGGLGAAHAADGAAARGRTGVGVLRRAGARAGEVAGVEAFEDEAGGLGGALLRAGAAGLALGVRHHLAEVADDPAEDVAALEE